MLGSLTRANLFLRPLRFALPVLGALIATGSVASSASFTYNGYTVKDEQYISISSPYSVAGGVGQVTLNGTGANAGQSLQVWCMDIYDFLQNTGTYQKGSLTTAGTGGSNPSLTAAMINQVGSLISHGTALLNSSTDVSAAVQLAIWEIEYGSGFAFSGLSGAVSALAAQYVANVTGAGIWSGGSYDVQLLTEAGNQSMAFVTPLPASWTMMLMGLAGLFAARRRKNKLEASYQLAA